MDIITFVVNIPKTAGGFTVTGFSRPAEEETLWGTFVFYGVLPFSEGPLFSDTIRTWFVDGTINPGGEIFGKRKDT